MTTQHPDYAKPGDVLDLPGFCSERVVRQPDAMRYRYAADATRCPLCGGVGIPWNGWFTCQTSCELAAIVETGECFVAIREPRP